MTPDENDKAEIYVQWKGTEVCLDLHCVCGYDGHLDAMFAYGVRCGGCERVYEMPHTFHIPPGDYDGPSPIAFAQHPDGFMHVPTGEGVPDVAVVTPTVFEMQDERDEYRRQRDALGQRVVELERQMDAVLALLEVTEEREIPAECWLIAKDIRAIYGGGGQ